MRIVNEPETIDGIRVVQDSEEIAEALRHGETVYHWEAGDSMRPLINHMEYCRIVPIHPESVQRGDAVFCKMTSEQGDYYMVHQVWEIANCGHDGRRGCLYHVCVREDCRRNGIGKEKQWQTK